MELFFVRLPMNIKAGSPLSRRAKCFYLVCKASNTYWLCTKDKTVGKSFATEPCVQASGELDTRIIKILVNDDEKRLVKDIAMVEAGQKYKELCSAVWRILLSDTSQYGVCSVVTAEHYTHEWQSMKIRDKGNGDFSIVRCDLDYEGDHPASVENAVAELQRFVDAHKVDSNS
jgi:hypothetical protein